MNRVFALAITLVTFGAPSLAGATPECPTKVLVNRSCVSAQTVNALQSSFRLKIPAGAYWYDRTSGLYGYDGQPAAGLLVPNLPFPGTLPRDASGGNTGVLINGRELHSIEVGYLRQLGPVLPGQYWLDAAGNVGQKGSAYPIANLFALIRSRAAMGRGGRDNYYGNISTGTYANSQGGCSYVMTPSGTVSSGC